MVKSNPDRAAPPLPDDLSSDKFTELNNEATRMAIVNPNSVTESPEPPFDGPGNLESVPEEVRKNMTGYDAMIAKERIMEILMNGRQASVDKIILALWHKHKFTADRPKIIGYLRQLCKERALEQVQGQRSVYRIAPSFIASASPGFTLPR